MVSFAAASRLSLRLAGRRWVQPSRGINMTARLSVAQNFTMPALSPTMTEGSIAAWRVKEGDRFAAGDVLLEIETDKATMDVEAQEDGVVFKIVQPDGSKGVPVGTRIAVLAEADDDVASLQMPPDETPAAAAAAPPEAPKETATATTATKAATAANTAASGTGARRQTLYPSVAFLIKQSGLDAAHLVDKITPTGPGGRVLKGDVLAYLGEVSPSVPAALEARFNSLSHLDLSNIKIKEKAQKPAAKPSAEETTAAAAAAKAKAVAEAETSVSLPVSLAAVLDAQGKIQASLGVFMPVSTFVSRATDVANDALPRAGLPPPPSAAALFDAIVSASARPSTALAASARLSRGFYHPQISALPTPASAAAPPQKKTKASVDVIDILSGKAKATTPAVRPAVATAKQPSAVSTGLNYFSLSVPMSEEKRAKFFLERLKVVLENEPGRLVL